MRIPFSAVVGLDDAGARPAAGAVDPAHRRGAAAGRQGVGQVDARPRPGALLPEGAPFVELPLGATEDRVVGYARRGRGPRRGRRTLRARPAGRGRRRGAVRRRGQPAARPPGGRAARRRRHRGQPGRAGRRVARPSQPLRAGRLDEPRGGRAAAPAARPLRARRSGSARRPIPQTGPRRSGAGSPSTPIRRGFVAEWRGGRGRSGRARADRPAGAARARRRAHGRRAVCRRGRRGPAGRPGDLPGRRGARRLVGRVGSRRPRRWRRWPRSRSGTAGARPSPPAPIDRASSTNCLDQTAAGTPTSAAGRPAERSAGRGRARGPDSASARAPDRGPRLRQAQARADGDPSQGRGPGRGRGTARTAPRAAGRAHRVAGASRGSGPEGRGRTVGDWSVGAPASAAPSRPAATVLAPPSSGPREPDRWRSRRRDLRSSRHEQRGDNVIVLAVDTSGSMGAADGWRPPGARCWPSSPTPTSAGTGWRSIAYRDRDGRGGAAADLEHRGGVGPPG